MDFGLGLGFGLELGLGFGLGLGLVGWWVGGLAGSTANQLRKLVTQRAIGFVIQ